MWAGWFSLARVSESGSQSAVAYIWAMREGGPPMAARRHAFFRNAVVLLGPVTCQAKPTGTLAFPSGATAPFANQMEGT